MTQPLRSYLIQTSYLVLFIVLISIGVGTASALVTITLDGDVLVTGDLTVDGSTTGQTITDLDTRMTILEGGP